MKKVNNFQVAKVEPQGDAKLLLDFFANFSLVLLIKVLLIKKACSAYLETWNTHQTIIN